MNKGKLSTLQVMSLGLLFAFIGILPIYKEMLNIGNVPLSDWLPVQIIYTGIQYMRVFFHELSHCFFAWFHGHPSLPAFNFVHGGEVAIYSNTQYITIIFAIWLAMIYLAIQAREDKRLLVAIAVLFIFNASISFTKHRYFVIIFMGPAIEPMIASYLLYRALFDKAPRGDLERFLNAFFGFGIIISSFIRDISILKYRYKGGGLVGDFEQIDSMYSSIDFNTPVIFLIIITVILFLFPFVLYCNKKTKTIGAVPDN